MSELTTDAHMRVSAIVVTYHPDFPVLQRQLTSLAHQVSAILIVDNTGNDSVADWVVSERIPNVTVHALAGNRGLGTAYNIGIAWAQKQQYTHVLFLDQDSLPENNMVAELADALLHIEQNGAKVSAVGPLCRDSRTGAFAPFRQFSWFGTRRIFCSGDARHIPADFLISSGSLVSLDALETVGGMKEDLFIDHIDTEWFLRASSFGMSAWGVCTAVMHHALGEDSYRIWFLGWRTIYRHKPFRYYYIFRNSILLWQLSYAPLRWISGDVVRIGVLAFSALLFGPCRFDYLKMILRGIGDGIRGKGGKFVSS